MTILEMLFLPWEHRSILWWYRQLSSACPALLVHCPSLFMYQILSASGCPVCLHTGAINFSRLCTKAITCLSLEGEHGSSNTKPTRTCCLINNIFLMAMHGLAHSRSLMYKVLSQNKDTVLPAVLGGQQWILLFWIFYLVIRSKQSINTWWQ